MPARRASSVLLSSCRTRSSRIHLLVLSHRGRRFVTSSGQARRPTRAATRAGPGRSWRLARYPRNVDQVRTLTAAVSKDGSWFVARCLEIEVASQGETIDEALANLREALELYFEDGDVTADLVHPLVTPIEIRIPA